MQLQKVGYIFQHDRKLSVLNAAGSKIEIKQPQAHAILTVVMTQKMTFAKERYPEGISALVK
jgi:hypothetical protein